MRPDLLTRALIDGDTAIATVLLNHPRFKEILNNTSTTTTLKPLIEMKDSNRFEIEHSPDSREKSDEA